MWFLVRDMLLSGNLLVGVPVLPLWKTLLWNLLVLVVPVPVPVLLRLLLTQSMPLFSKLRLPEAAPLLLPRPPPCVLLLLETVLKLCEPVLWNLLVLVVLVLLLIWRLLTQSMPLLSKLRLPEAAPLLLQRPMPSLLLEPVLGFSELLVWSSSWSGLC